MTTDDDTDDGYVLIIESAPRVMYAHIWIPAPYYTEADAWEMAAERAIEHSTTVRLLHRGVELACIEMRDGKATTVLTHNIRVILMWQHTCASKC